VNSVLYGAVTGNIVLRIMQNFWWHQLALISYLYRFFRIVFFCLFDDLLEEQLIAG